MSKDISPHVYVKKDGVKIIGLVPTDTNKLYAKRYKDAQKEAKEWQKPWIKLSKDKSWQHCVICGRGIGDGHDHDV